METVRETDQDGAEESEEQDDSCTVGLLLDMSTECSLSEQDPCDLHDASDWDGAVSNHTLTHSLAHSLTRSLLGQLYTSGTLWKHYLVPLIVFYTSGTWSTYVNALMRYWLVSTFCCFNGKR